MSKLQFLIIIMIVVVITSCAIFDDDDPATEDIYGCMDSTATNFNPDATIDDGNCDYCEEGASFILISTDGGENWNIKCLKQTIGDVFDISIIDSNNIWICTSAHNFIHYSQILHTSDGGRTWTEQYSFDNSILGQVDFDYIEFFDLNNGIALASGVHNFIPIFLKTTDGGKDWIQTTTAAIGISGDIWRRVDFVNVNVGYFFESLVNPQKLYKTEDSGSNWTELAFDDYAYVLKFYNKDIGIVASNYNNILRTLDGGATWDKVQNIYTTWAKDIEFDSNDPSRVWLLSDSLYFSSDTGSIWQSCFELTDNGFDALSYSNSVLWVYNRKRYLRKVDVNDCTNYDDIQLPKYQYGDMNLGFDFDVVGDTIVILGSF